MIVKDPHFFGFFFFFLALLTVKDLSFTSITLVTLHESKWPVRIVEKQELYLIHLIQRNHVTWKWWLSMMYLEHSHFEAPFILFHFFPFFFLVFGYTNHHAKRSCYELFMGNWLSLSRPTHERNFSRANLIRGNFLRTHQNFQNCQFFHQNIKIDNFSIKTVNFPIKTQHYVFCHLFFI